MSTKTESKPSQNQATIDTGLSLEERFAHLLHVLEPTPTLLNHLQEQLNRLRDCLKENAFSADYDFLNLCLSGAYAQDTALRARENEQSTVDINFYLDKTPDEIHPAALIEGLFIHLKQEYAQIARFKRGIRLREGELDLILTPILAPFDSDTFYVPGPKLQDWQQTAAHAHKEWADEQNIASDGQFRTVVRLFKHWQRLHLNPDHQLSGFIISQLVAKNLGENSSAPGKVFVRTMESIVTRFVTSHALGMTPHLKDPCLPGSSILKSTPLARFRGFYQGVKTHAEIGRQALLSGDDAGTIQFWSIIFGEAYFSGPEPIDEFDDGRQAFHDLIPSDEALLISDSGIVYTDSKSGETIEVPIHEAFENTRLPLPGEERYIKVDAFLARQELEQDDHPHSEIFSYYAKDFTPAAEETPAAAELSAKAPEETNSVAAPVEAAPIISATSAAAIEINDVQNLAASEEIPSAAVPEIPLAELSADPEQAKQQHIAQNLNPIDSAEEEEEEQAHAANDSVPPAAPTSAAIQPSPTTPTAPQLEQQALSAAQTKAESVAQAPVIPPLTSNPLAGLSFPLAAKPDPNTLVSGRFPLEALGLQARPTQTTPTPPAAAPMARVSEPTPPAPSTPQPISEAATASREPELAAIPQTPGREEPAAPAPEAEPAEPQVKSLTPERLNRLSAALDNVTQSVRDPQAEAAAPSTSEALSPLLAGVQRQVQRRTTPTTAQPIPAAVIAENPTEHLTTEHPPLATTANATPQPSAIPSEAVAEPIAHIPDAPLETVANDFTDTQNLTAALTASTAAAQPAPISKPRLETREEPLYFDDDHGLDDEDYLEETNPQPAATNTLSAEHPFSINNQLFAEEQKDKPAADFAWSEQKHRPIPARRNRFFDSIDEAMASAGEIPRNEIAEFGKIRADRAALVPEETPIKVVIPESVQTQHEAQEDEENFAFFTSQDAPANQAETAQEDNAEWEWGSRLRDLNDDASPSEGDILAFYQQSTPIAETTTATSEPEPIPVEQADLSDFGLNEEELATYQAYLQADESTQTANTQAEPSPSEGIAPLAAQLSSEIPALTAAATSDFPIETPAALDPVASPALSPAVNEPQDAFTQAYFTAVNQCADSADPSHGFAILQSALDDPEEQAEILEIFLEESEEVIESLQEYLPRWNANLDDHDALNNIRRSFHTLKGSSRMAGAQLLGEFAWQHENLLNRVIDASVKAEPFLLDELQLAVETLPELIAQLQNPALPTNPEIPGLMREAQALAKPEFPEILQSLLESAETEETPPLVPMASPAVSAHAALADELPETAELTTAELTTAEFTSLNPFDDAASQRLPASDIPDEDHFPELPVLSELASHHAAEETPHLAQFIESEPLSANVPAPRLETPTDSAKPTPVDSAETAVPSATAEIIADEIADIPALELEAAIPHLETLAEPEPEPTEQPTAAQDNHPATLSATEVSALIEQHLAHSLPPATPVKRDKHDFAQHPLFSAYETLESDRQELPAKPDEALSLEILEPRVTTARALVEATASQETVPDLLQIPEDDAWLAAEEQATAAEATENPLGPVWIPEAPSAENSAAAKDSAKLEPENEASPAPIASDTETPVSPSTVQDSDAVSSDSGPTRLEEQETPTQASIPEPAANSETQPVAQAPYSRTASSALSRVDDAAAQATPEITTASATESASLQTESRFDAAQFTSPENAENASEDLTQTHLLTRRSLQELEQTADEAAIPADSAATTRTVSKLSDLDFVSDALVEISVEAQEVNAEIELDLFDEVSAIPAFAQQLQPPRPQAAIAGNTFDSLVRNKLQQHTQTAQNPLRTPTPVHTSAADSNSNQVRPTPNPNPSALQPKISPAIEQNQLETHLSTLPLEEVELHPLQSPPTNVEDLENTEVLALEKLKIQTQKTAYQQDLTNVTFAEETSLHNAHESATTTDPELSPLPQPIPKPEIAPAPASPISRQVALDDIPDETVKTLKLGEILVAQGLLSADDVSEIIDYQHQKKLRFGDAALELKKLDADVLTTALSKQFDYHYAAQTDFNLSEQLVAAHAPFAEKTEQLRSLRLKIAQAIREQGIQNFAVVSPERNEGRSYISANLAILFAQQGSRTLLIDANLRQPRLHEWFNCKPTPGLSEILAGRIESNHITRIPGFDQMSFMTAGAIPPNPLELLGRQRLKWILRSLREHYEIIILDTPAARYSSDAESIATQVDSNLVVARRHKTLLSDLQGQVKLLRSANADILGSVFNDYDD